ncbi:MAG: radical SAM protein [Planctomycetes bacterium]|nr:radical SAM protein [Planctomycetota bacterium]
MKGLVRIAHDLGAGLGKASPRLRRTLHAVREGAQIVHHSLAGCVPALIRPDTVSLTVAMTARCNQRCHGCLYERGFMAGQQLGKQTLDDLVDDAAALGVRSLRLYGGEPLLHPDLAAVVERAVGKGVGTYVTTNGVLLEQRIDELFSAGLRHLTFGLYGAGAAYDDYAGRRGNFERVERGVASVRERYGAAVRMRMNWLLMRPTCTEQALRAAWEFACRYATPMQIDLLHYSLPYFTEGPERELQFRPEDRPAIERIVEMLLACKKERPDLVETSEVALRAIPDWLLRGADMRVPCDKYRMLWIGADGTVQLCYVTFELGNLKEHRLRDLIGTEAHTRAARDAFALRCPNCHCGYDERTRKHWPTRRAYSS